MPGDTYLSWDIEKDRVRIKNQAFSPTSDLWVFDELHTEDFGGEPVLAGVLRGACFACGGFGAGGFFCGLSSGVEESL